MQVHVSDVKNVPDGSILSIRAGQTRRQAPLPLAEPLRFPNLPLNAKHFKVDILSSLGTTRLEIEARRPEEAYAVRVDLNNGQTATATLTVREEPSLCGKQSAELKQFERNLRCESIGKTPEPIASTRASPSPVGAKLDTREYAREHNLSGVVQAMLQQVLLCRPECPYEFMSEYLRKCSLEHGEPQPNPEKDAERVRLEAVHIALRQQRANLLNELAELEALALSSPNIATASSR